MAVEISAPATLTAPGPLTVTFNPAFPGPADYFWLTDIQGLGQAALRTRLDPKPQAHGAIIHPFWRDARHLTITGQLVAQSGISVRNTKADALEAALEAIEQADGTWTWTPTGQSLKTLTVRCDVNVVWSRSSVTVTDFVFGLVAADPAIT